MYNILAQIILARRNNDTEGWMNILFIVVLAIFWAIGGIIKARSRKSDTPVEKPMPRRPAHRLPQRTGPPAEQLFEKSRQSVGTEPHRESHPVAKKRPVKFSDIRAAIEKFAAEAEQAFQAQAEETVPQASIPATETKITVPKTEINRDILKTPEPTGKSLIQPEGKLTAVPTEMTETEYLTDFIFNYDDPEELRRAILHYEILGRPLSLRDPSEDITEL